MTLCNFTRLTANLGTTVTLTSQSLLSGGGPTLVGRDRRFLYVGCFRDRYKRALPRLILRVRGSHKGFWLVNRCGRITLRRGYRVFSAQNHNECWTGPKAHLTYNKYGRSTSCSHNTGGVSANDVYRVKGGERLRN